MKLKTYKIMIFYKYKFIELRKYKNLFLCNKIYIILYYI